MLIQKIKKKRDLPAVSFNNCIAKTDPDGNPGINVQQHLLNVAAVCQALSKELPAALSALFQFAIQAAAVHDIGKISPGFQLKYFRETVEKIVPEISGVKQYDFCTDHSHTGGCALWYYLGNPFKCPSVAQIAAMHHGSVKIDTLPEDTGTTFGGKKWSDQRKLLIQKIEKEFGTLITKTLSSAERDFVAGMVTISDWIGSDESFFPPNGLSKGTQIKNIADNAVTECGLRHPDIIKGLSFEEIFGFKPFQVQKHLGDVADRPGVYVLEAPMGMGKTEAALYAAYLLMSKGDNKGLFFGLPTRLTSDRIYKRINSFLEKICTQQTRPKLAHGTAWLKAFESGGEELSPGNAWFNPRKRALLNPFVVGTIDQALLSVLRVKHYFVRSFALAGKVVILDEVHSYDGYTGTLMDDMVSQLTELGCSVIILSATLTAQRRAAFFIDRSVSENTDYPLISGENFTQSADPPEEKKYDVSIQNLSNCAVAKLAVTKARKGHCVLCIANTVAMSQTWYDVILSEMTADECLVGLLHSKFPGFRRTEIENHWIDILGKNGQRPKSCILVATQVVEQSVDIDADFLITELAPTDMLLQRMGRQWRHKRNNRPCKNPEIIIISGNPEAAQNIDSLYEEFGQSNCKVYAPWVLWQTWTVWKQYKTIVLPQNIRDLLEATYCWRPETASELVKGLRDDFETMRDRLCGKARANLSTTTHMPVGQDHEGCATRYSDLPTSQILLVQGIDSTGNTAQLKLLNGKTVTVNTFKPEMSVTAELHRNLVTITSYLLNRIEKVQTPPFLQKHFYEPTPVLLWDETSGEITLNNKRTDFKYTHRKGLFRIMESDTINSDYENYVSDFEECNIFDKSRFDW